MTTLPVVLFVGGMPRSGTTLADLMLGQLPHHCDVGELFYMWQAGPLRNQRCACGADFRDCPFWTAVGEHAYGGWDRVDVHRVLDLQRRVDTTARLPLALAGRGGWGRDVEEYLGHLRRLYAAVAAVSAARVVVDSTKRPSTAYLLHEMNGLDLRVLHVVRDPRGVVNSWSREVPLPENAGARSYLKRRGLTQVLRRWVTVNVMTERLAARGVPVLRIRYEDLVRDPAGAMTAVLDLVGEPAGPDALAFLGPDGVAPHRSHAVAGGRVRMRSGPLVLRLDEAWRRELPPWKQRLVRAVAGPVMRRYGYRA